MGLHLYSKKGLHKLPRIMLGLVLLAGLNTVHADKHGLGPMVTIPESSGKQCVLPAEQIRREHPDLLQHDRVKTMREGVRAKSDGTMLDGSLKQCINCHAIKDDNNKYVRIDNEQHFCASCHKYAAVTIDCFQCHRDIPEGSKDFHALSYPKQLDFTNIVPGGYNLTIKDLANVVPEVNSDAK